jgi:hypothetical protein
MADAAVVHIGENSPEGVAYRLMTLVRTVNSSVASKDKDEILNLYAECLNAVQYPQSRAKIN